MGVKFISKTVLISLIILLFTHPVFSQNTGGKYSDMYLRGIDLYEKGLYSDAEMIFAKTAEKADPTDMLTLSEIAYYRAMCAIELKLSNLESYVDYLTGNFPENKNINQISFLTANYFFHEKDYKKARIWYEKVDSRTLRYNQHMERTFKLGYTYFELKQYAKASHCFVEVKGAPTTPYSAPAAYYYGYIEYQKKNYVSAQLAFEKVLQDDRFAAQASLYLLQIYYLQQEYEKVIDMGTNIQPALSAPYDKEVARMLAEAFFHTENYEKAQEYIAIYSKNITAYTRADDYFFGLIDYNTQNYESAIAHFEKVSANKKDSLAQNALYYLGSVYLNLDNKTKAQQAFQLAAQQTALPAVTQDAMLQYAKLSLELQSNGEPLKKYIDKYPVKTKDPEIQRYLVAYYINNGEYKKALDELAPVKDLSDKELADMQRLNFIVGKELYDSNNFSNYPDAINYFDASLKIARYNARIEALAKYYKADVRFALGQYKEAQQEFEQFISGSGAFRTGGEYITAYYNLGYCYFKLKSNDNAIRWFREFIKLAGSSVAYKVQVADAYNRIGDCNYVQSKFWPAIDNYTKAEELKTANPDYALYQKAISFGLINRGERKIETLTDLATNYPQSAYAPVGLLELGRTYQQNNQYQNAESTLKKLLDNYAKSPYMPQALIELGLIYTNTNRSTEAIDAYKEAQQQSAANSTDEKSALIGLQNIYVDMGTPHLYYDYLASIGKETNRKEQEQAMYNAAEKLANTGNCLQAIPEFQQFLKDFPTSTFSVQANYHLGNCYFQNTDYTSAVVCYNHVANDPNYTAYKEQALLKSGQANMKLDNNEAAIDNFRALVNITTDPSLRLSAFLDMARLHFNKLQNYLEAVNVAQSALSIPAIASAQAREMKLIRASSLRLLGQKADAQSMYKELVAEDKNDKENAEATYYIIEQTFQEDGFEEGEKMTLQFINSKANTYQYWTARALIILAGQYAAQGNTMQAEATYNSILDGYKNTTDGILETVRQQLQSLKTLDTQ